MNIQTHKLSERHKLYSAILKFLDNETDANNNVENKITMIFERIIK